MNLRPWNLAGCVAMVALLVALPFGVRADDRIRLEAVLQGTDNDPAAFGRARFEVQGDRARFEVRVEGITSASVVFVVVGEDFLGAIELDDQGRGELRLDSQNGDVIPEIAGGDTVGIFGDDPFPLLAEGVLVKNN